MNVLAVFAEEYLQLLNNGRFISECSHPSKRKLVNSNNASSFFLHPICGVKVKALDVHSVRCEISDVMVAAFIKFS